MSKLSTEFQAKFNSFFDGVQKIHREYMERNFPGNRIDNFEYEVGRKFIKVIRGDSVHCFVDIETGNVHKAASWKAPERRNPRGNIFNLDNGLSGITWCGVVYLR